MLESNNAGYGRAAFYLVFLFLLKYPFIAELSL